MSNGLIDLISILDLEPIEVNMFRGRSPMTSWQRVFGGQVIGQAMVAACRTVEGRMPHSLHCYFILPGDPQIPIIYEVERLRDGKSYSTRRVTAIQHGNAIFSIMVSFHVEEEGSFDHQDKMPDVPPPEKLTAEEVAKQPIFKEMPDFIKRYYESDRPIELRPVELSRYFGQKIEDGRIHVWIRTAAKLPDDPALHMCALAYASDFSLLDAVMARYGRTLFDKRMMPASLDHAMWFHRPFRADEWLLYSQDFTKRPGRARPDPGLDFQTGWHAGGFGRPGRLSPRAQGKAGQGVGRILWQPDLLHRKNPLRRRFYNSELRHEPACVPTQDPRYRDDQDHAQAENHRPPQHLPPAGVELDVSPGAGNVTADPPHPGRDHPRPADNGDD